MASQSDIEWTEQTWNPVTGCIKVSPGCKNCYAETLARRLEAMGTPGYKDGFSSVSLLAERLDQPRRRRKPTIYFVNSMSDLFQEAVPFTFIDQVMGVIRDTPQHTFQILTKRAKRMSKYFERRAVPDNAWLGVSVEDRKYGLPRVPLLQTIEAKTRFLSVEPLLEDLGSFNLEGIHWVIVGGESGHKARPMKLEWVLGVQDLCERADVDFFFKQWGNWGVDGKRRSKKQNGRQLNGRTFDAMPLINTATI